jgi:hypothetical protein
MDHHPASGKCSLGPLAYSGICVLALVGGFAPQTARAADEDSTTSVYLEFDPKTGDFKTVHDTDRSKQRAENQADDRSMLHPLSPDGTADPASAAEGAAPGASGHSSGHTSAGGAQSGAASGASTPLIVGAVAAVAVLLGLALAWFRRSERKAH